MPRAAIAPIALSVITLCARAAPISAGHPVENWARFGKPGDAPAAVKGLYAGNLVPFGQDAFALLADGEGHVPAAVGSLGGKVIVFSHDGIPGQAPALFERVVRWCAAPGAKFAVLGGSPLEARMTELGYRRDDAAPDFILMRGVGSPEAMAEVEKRVRAGAALIVTTTTWAQSGPQSARLETFLLKCGLHVADPFEIGADLPYESPTSRLLSAGYAARMLADSSGKLDAADKKIALRSLEETLAIPEAAKLADAVLQSGGGTGAPAVPTLEKPYLINRDPEADFRLAAEMYAADHVTPEKLYVHPAAKHFPGRSAAGAPVDQRLSFRAASPKDDAYVNQAIHGTWIETDLYADAGEVVTVTIPASLAGKGLKVQIGLHEDRLWRSENAMEEGLLRFPSVTRVFDLNQAETRIGTPFGGLIRFFCEPGTDLGTVDARIAGALEAPAYVLGKTDAASWQTEQKKPGAWGSIRTPLFTAYVPREALVAMADPGGIARHWQKVFALADEWLGYAKWRVRPDCAVQDVQISGGLHHAGYPLMLGGGDPNLLLAPTVLTNGDWGIYHEIGHGYQSCFRDQYTLAPHPEVDVNLVPGLVYFFLHGRTAWDGETHSTYDGASREADMAKFLALPEDQQTWEAACESAAAYDFHFGLAEAFGWEVWRSALGRLIAYGHDPASDAELASVSGDDPAQALRDRMLVCLSAASGCDLTPWFNRYGLGKGTYPLGKKARAIVAKLPAWNGNRPVTAVTGRTSVAMAKTVTGGTLETYHATDPDPGQIFEWDLIAGNDDGAFSIDKRTGALLLQKTTAAARRLTLRVRDCGVPRYGKTLEVDVTR